MSLTRPKIVDDMVRQTARDIADKSIKPLAAEIDASHRFPSELAEILHQVGFLSLLVPEEHGGGGGNVRHVASIAEELAYGDVSTTMIFTLQSTCVEVLRHLVQGEQAASLFKRVVDGSLLAIALTESGAGSDAAALRTFARREDDEYVIDGEKIYITNADVADVLLVFVQTDVPGSRDGIRLALVDRETPGVTVGRGEDKMGLHGSATCPINFTNVRVPISQVVGESGLAYQELMRALERGRVIIASVAVGLAQSALDRATAYATVREQFGQAIGSFQGVQFLLADMAMKVTYSRTLVDAAVASAVDDDPDFAAVAAMAKCVATDTAMSVTTDAVQVFGGAGYIREMGVERLMRDAKILQIFEGTNQIMRSIVGRQLLRNAKDSRSQTRPDSPVRSTCPVASAPVVVDKGERS